MKGFLEMHELPEPNFYTLEMLARKWGCKVNDILHYGLTGQLKISVLSSGWYLEGGYYDEIEENRPPHRIPDIQRWTINELFVLHHFDLSILAKESILENPNFEAEPGRYLEVSGMHHTPDSPPHGAKIIGLRDLMIKLEHVREFEEKRSSRSPDIEYISPYMALMFESIKHLKISDSNQLKKEEIKSWFLGKKIHDHVISDNEAGKLASFVRWPSKGGNTKVG